MIKFFVPLLFIFQFSLAQAPTKPIYSSLLWEITGKGLSKPSYLFGTMHVSSKLAFNLSDSFYYALKNVDAVALELNPEEWQPQMIRLNELNKNYARFTQSAGNNYLTEQSFKLANYEDKLKLAMNAEPPVVNSLLYRSYASKEDFEEDTFLDLYIFQTGRKLGKLPAGVEDYITSEKIVLEAYADMAKEKNKKNLDFDGESIGDVQRKIQNAYRQGDLDLMDSLDYLMERSLVFREKFLYKRNEIQAASIDSILKIRSLFAGVGAAHLPGDRGVISILRKMGYVLRPIKMTNRDASQKEGIDKLKVPVKFTKQYSADGIFTVNAPGNLYTLDNNYQQLNRIQYADMNNGAYYLITRVKTYTSFFGESTDVVLQKVDSLLYENIPGNIVSKKSIQKNGYTGFDIINRTRRGNMQRYQIFVLPFEVIFFKMSGKGDYVAGEEGKTFFNSIQLNPTSKLPNSFAPAYLDFSLNLPQTPHRLLNAVASNRWEFEALDTITNDAWLIIKQSIYNYDFIEEDSFELSLASASFRATDQFEKQESSKATKVGGYEALQVREKLKNGQYVNGIFINKGPHYYLIAKRPGNQLDTSFAFVNNISWKPIQYQPAKLYVDTFLHVGVQTPVTPDIDASIRQLIENAMADAANGKFSNGFASYWQPVKYGTFESDSTGELISIEVQRYPRYFFIKDTAKYWQRITDEYSTKRGMFLKEKQRINLGDTLQGYQLALTDTGSTKQQTVLMLQQNDYLVTVTTVADTLLPTSSFVSNYLQTVKPYNTDKTFGLYNAKMDLFAADFFSADSLKQRKATASIGNILFRANNVEQMRTIIKNLKLTDKNYFENKKNLIAELGFISDSFPNSIPDLIVKIYVEAGDTAVFQNEALKALAHFKTNYAYKLLKDLILKEPPVFYEDSEYNGFINSMADSLALAAKLFPQLITLTTLSDYKAPIINLLVSLADSGLITKKSYQKYFPSLFIDAKVALKKQQAKDEKRQQEAMQKLSANADDEDDANLRTDFTKDPFYLSDYAVLLISYYKTKAEVKSFFERLLQTRDVGIRMRTVLLLLKHNIPVPAPIIASIAEQQKYLGVFYDALQTAGSIGLLADKYKDQLQVAQSMLLHSSSYEKFDSIVFLQKDTVLYKQKAGVTYAFKYRFKKTDEWKIGISGLQPLDAKAISNSNEFTLLTSKNLKVNEPIDTQVQVQLKKLQYGLRKAARYFYVDQDNYSSGFQDYDD